MQLHIGNMFEVLSLLVVILYYPNLRGTIMRWFLPFLFFICICEFIMKYQWFVLRKSPVGMNYLIGIVESFFYGYIFYNLSVNATLKKVLLYFIPLSIISYLFSYLANSSTYIYFTPNIIFSGFFLAAVSLINLYLKYLDDEQSNLLLEPVFWISLGVSLFFSSISISFSLYDLIRSNHLNLFGLNLYILIPRFSSVILYLSISIAIILCKRQKKML